MNTPTATSNVTTPAASHGRPSNPPHDALVCPGRNTTGPGAQGRSPMLKSPMTAVRRPMPARPPSISARTPRRLRYNPRAMPGGTVKIPIWLTPRATHTPATVHAAKRIHVTMPIDRTSRARLPARRAMLAGAFAIALLAVTAPAAAGRSPAICTRLALRPAGPPHASTLGARVARRGRVVLSGAVSSGRLATTWYFEVSFERRTRGSYTAWTLATRPRHADACASHRRVSQAIHGVTCGRRYRYRLVAHNALGTAFGRLLAFRTAPCRGSIQ